MKHTQLNEFGPGAGSGNVRANDLDNKRKDAAKKSEKGETIYVVGSKYGSYKLSKYFEKGNTYAAYYNGMPQVVEEGLVNEAAKNDNVITFKKFKDIDHTRLVKWMQNEFGNKYNPGMKWLGGHLVNGGDFELDVTDWDTRDLADLKKYLKSQSYISEGIVNEGQSSRRTQDTKKKIMKISQFRKLIQEEVRRVLKESNKMNAYISSTDGTTFKIYDKNKQEVDSVSLQQLEDMMRVGENYRATPNWQNFIDKFNKATPKGRHWKYWKGDLVNVTIANM